MDLQFTDIQMMGKATDDRIVERDRTHATVDRAIKAICMQHAQMFAFVQFGFAEREEDQLVASIHIYRHYLIESD